MKIWVNIFFTLTLAFILEIIPLPDKLDWLRPEIVVLMMIYWTLSLPHRMGVFWAFFVGIILDLLMGTLLGEHALVLVLVTYLVVKFNVRLRLFPIWQQSLIVFFLILFYQGALFWIQVLQGQAPNTWFYWLPSLTSALVWPWLRALLKDYRRRYKIVY